MVFVWRDIEVVRGEPSEKILVIARNVRHIVEWCRSHNINYRSRNIKFVTGVTDLMKVTVTRAYYVDLGTDKPEFRDLIETMAALGHIKPLVYEVLLHKNVRRS